MADGPKLPFQKYKGCQQTASPDLTVTTGS
jgi:hypothetical protein